MKGTSSYLADRQGKELALTWLIDEELALTWLTDEELALTWLTDKERS